MPSSQPVILFDGVCQFCNGAVNFVIRQDKAKVFLFAALQSDAGQRLLQQHNLDQQPFSSFVLIDGERTLVKSTAALKVIGQLPWYWQWAQLFWLIPRFIRDSVYDFIARNRYKWFGKKETCMVPSMQVRSRFLS